MVPTGNLLEQVLADELYFDLLPCRPPILFHAILQHPQASLGVFSFIKRVKKAL
jgi:hypothetical protein